MNRATHWSQLGENTCVWGLWIMLAIYRVLGRQLFRLCLYPLVGYYCLAMPVARRSSMQYLRRCAQMSRKLARVRWWHCVHHFACFADTLLDQVLAVTQRFPSHLIAFQGRDVMLEQLACGRGAVIVTAHVGCLTLLQALSQKRSNLKLNILVHTAHATRINAFLRRLNPHSAVKLLEIADFTPATAIALGQAVDAGEFLVIAGDRIPASGHQVVEAMFLGHLAPFPIGPYVFASLLHCSLYMVGCVHHGRGYQVQFLRLASRVDLPRRGRVKALTHYASLYAAQLEAWVIKAPFDWFNFYPFWQSASPRFARSAVEDAA